MNAEVYIIFKKNDHQKLAAFCGPRALYSLWMDPGLMPEILTATLDSIDREEPLCPFYKSSTLGLWVAADPDHRGRKLGTLVSGAATRRLVEAGYRRIYLLTDDFRLPAIRIYLALGYTPLYHAPDMPERWQSVLQQLA